MKDILRLEGINAGYFKKEVLHDVSLRLNENSLLLLIGPNGAGKSTVLKVIAGLLKPWSGKIFFEGKSLDTLSAAHRSRLGIGYFIQGGKIFVNLSVRENLEIASLDPMGFKENIGMIFQIFPALKSMQKRRAGLLSGGEKHQLALGMIFMRRPKLMLLDEPSAGLSPLLVSEIIESIQKMKQALKGSVLLVEQNIKVGLGIADAVCLMKAGSVVKAVEPKKVLAEDLLETLFFE